MAIAGVLARGYGGRCEGVPASGGELESRSKRGSGVDDEIFDGGELRALEFTGETGL